MLYAAEKHNRHDKAEQQMYQHLHTKVDARISSTQETN